MVNDYTLASFRGGFRADDGFEAFAWVRNTFDEEYFEQREPRTYGLTLRVRL